MQHVSKEMQACIDECMGCYKVCLGMAMTHCLEQGGKHVEPKHFRLMMACAEICRTSAHFMLIRTPHHKPRAACRWAPLPGVRLSRPASNTRSRTCTSFRWAS